MTILEKASYAVLATVIAISLWFAKNDLDYFD